MGETGHEVRAQVERILATTGFRQSERLSRLLRYLVDRVVHDGGGGLKEYVLGVEVFDRPESFDPRADSIVRVEVHRLRAKLTLYYATVGRDDPILIELPRGTYAPVITDRTREDGLRPDTGPAGARESGGGSQTDPTGPEAAAPQRWLRWRPTRRATAVVAALTVVATVGWTVVDRWKGPAGFGRPSVAVLPFVTPGADPIDASLADAFVGDLTAALARIDGLRVAARSSAFQFRGEAEDLRGVSRQLGVKAIVEGSLRRSGGRLRLTVQLIRASDQMHIWADSTDQTDTTLTAVVDRVARGIAGALGVTEVPRDRVLANGAAPPASGLTPIRPSQPPSPAPPR